MKKIHYILSCLMLSLVMVACNNDEPNDPTAVLFKLPANMEVNAETNPDLGNTEMDVKFGIKSVNVRIASTSADMKASLQAISQNMPQVNFLKGVELVENQALQQFFASLGQHMDLPDLGDKDYTFPVGKFFPLLALMPGVHEFIITVTDINGNHKTVSIKLTVKP